MFYVVYKIIVGVERCLSGNPENSTKVWVDKQMCWIDYYGRGQLDDNRKGLSEKVVEKMKTYNKLTRANIKCLQINCLQIIRIIQKDEDNYEINVNNSIQ